ncbi:hypothetical protein INR49_002740 [Caranx melampygus]|nr:hypothetical protein INR49_002740 [Caranx melampygus]
MESCDAFGLVSIGIWHCYAFGFTLPYLANQPITVYAERIKVGQVPTSALSLPASSARPLPGRCLCRSPHSTEDSFNNQLRRRRRRGRDARRKELLPPWGFFWLHSERNPPVQSCPALLRARRRSDRRLTEPEEDKQRAENLADSLSP